MQKQLTFEQFKQAIDVIIAHNAEIDAFTTAIASAFEDSFLICTLGQKSIKGLIDVLQQVLDCYDWVEYFIYECDYGKSPGTVTLIDGREIIVDSIERIWDVIHATS